MHLNGAGGIISNVTKGKVKYLWLDLTVSPDLASDTWDRETSTSVPEEGPHHHTFLTTHLQRETSYVHVDFSLALIGVNIKFKIIRCHLITYSSWHLWGPVNQCTSSNVAPVIVGSRNKCHSFLLAVDFTRSRRFSIVSWDLLLNLPPSSGQDVDKSHDLYTSLALTNTELALTQTPSDLLFCSSLYCFPAVFTGGI